MLSTKSNQPASIQNPSSAQAETFMEMYSPLITTCCLGVVAAILGFTALVYQFAPDLNKIKPHRGQVEMLQPSFYS